MSCHNLNRNVAFHQCGLILVFSNNPFVKITCHILNRHVAFHPCESVCFFKCTFCENALSHCEHTCGFSSVVLFALKFAFNENALSHFEQGCGFSPVWISSCVSKFSFWENTFSHFEQVCGFSPLWINLCLFKSPFSEKSFKCSSCNQSVTKESRSLRNPTAVQTLARH